MERVAIYPYNAELLPYVKYFCKLDKNSKLTKLYSPSGYCLIGKDAAYAHNHPEIGLSVTDACSIDVADFDTLLLACGIDEENDELYPQIGEITRLVSESGKRIVKCEDFSGEYYMTHKRTLGDFGTVRTPIILIGGILTQADTTDVLIALHLELCERGFRPATLSRHPIGKFFGLHTTYDILNDTSLKEIEKTYRINNFLRNIENYELPDVILVEAPDAVMSFSTIVPNGFGIYTNMVCRAATPDYFVCCVPCVLGSGTFLESISKKFEHTLGVGITAAHISNTFADSADILATREFSHAYADLSFVKVQLEKEKLKSEIHMSDVIGSGINEIYTYLFEQEG